MVFGKQTQQDRDIEEEFIEDDYDEQEEEQMDINTWNHILNSNMIHREEDLIYFKSKNPDYRYCAMCGKEKTNLRSICDTCLNELK
jgi:hypothetical protein